MKKKLFLIPVSLMMLASCGNDEPVQKADENKDAEPIVAENNWELSKELNLTSDEKTVLANFNDFNYNLVEQFARQSPDGFSISPISIAMYLGMVANATDGEARDEIIETLNVTDLGSLNSLNNKLMHYLPADGNGALLDINNRLWLADRYSAPQQTADNLLNNFNAAIEYVDFGTSTTVPKINRWISDRTHGLIKSILDGDWQEYISTSALIANTVYFKGEWALKFIKAETGKATFHTTKGDVSVDMMHQTVATDYYNNDKMQVVTLSYKGGLNTIELYLPAEGVSVNEMLGSLDGEAQSKVRSESRPYYVDLSLPKFESAYGTDMTYLLNNLGVKALLNMSPLGINELQTLTTLHKTSIRVDEDGTELAAVTGGYAMSTGEEPERNTVKVTYDRPFFYIVRNNVANVVLMAGMVTNPLR